MPLHPPERGNRRQQEQYAWQDRCREWRPGVEQTDVREQVVQQVETHADHDANENFQRQSAAARVHVGKRQRQHHHHDHRDRVQQLAPQRDFILFAALLVLPQVAAEQRQVDCRHALGVRHQDRENLGRDVGPERAAVEFVPVEQFGPHPLRRFCRLHADLVDAGKPPHARLDEFGTVRRNTRTHVHVLIELEQVYAAHRAARLDLARIDETGADHRIRSGIADHVFGPQAAAEFGGQRRTFNAALELLPEIVGLRRQRSSPN